MPEETSLWRMGWQEPLAGLRRQLLPFHRKLNQARWLWRIAMRWRLFDVCQKKVLSQQSQRLNWLLSDSHVCTSWRWVPPILTANFSRTLLITWIRLRWCQENVYQPNIRPFRISPHTKCVHFHGSAVMFCTVSPNIHELCLWQPKDKMVSLNYK